MGVVDTINAASRRLPKWAIYVVGLVPSSILIAQIFTGGLGVDPVKALEHELGKLALQIFILTLVISPLRRFAGINLIRHRRAIGHLVFIYVLLHLLIWVVLDMGLYWGQMWRDILKRPYITIGIIGFLLLLPVMATSNDISIRKLGAATWKRVHRFVYPAIFLGGVHYVMVQKVWEAEPLIYLGVILGLLALRLRPGKMSGRTNKLKAAK